MTNKDNNGLGNLDDLFRSARADGLTNQTMDLVISNLNGPTLATAVGTPLHQLASNEVTLAMNIIDMSGSMAPHAEDLINAYNNHYLMALRGSSASQDILVSTIRFNQEVTLLHGYLPLQDAPLLSRSSYTPGGTTALYDAVAGGITNMVLYTQQLRQSGVMVRCIIIVYSDGADNASKQRAKQIRRAAAELLKHEIYTLAYVGFHPGGINQVELRRLADEIGFPDALQAGLDPQELRRVFNLVSTSTISMSQQGNVPTGIFS